MNGFRPCFQYILSKFNLIHLKFCLIILILTGYVGDSEANTLAFDSEGWLKTGDICYFDEDGFLYIVDRLKEMIKYKAYQVDMH